MANTVNNSQIDASGLESIALKKKEIEEKLIEEIVANTSQQTQSIPAASGQQKSDVADVQTKIGATNTAATSVQTSALDQPLNFLTDKLTTVKSGLSPQKQMIKAQALHSEVQETGRLTGAAVQSNHGLGDDWPSPYSGMPSGAPKPGTPDPFGDDPLYIYEQMYTYLGNIQTDPRNLDWMMEQIVDDSKSGKMSPDVLNWLNSFGSLTGSSDIHDGFIGMWANQAAEYAYFAGYDGKKGVDAMNAWKADINNELNSIPPDKRNNLTGAMGMCANDIDPTSFNTAHQYEGPTGGNFPQKGDYIFTTPDGKIYDWTHPFSDDPKTGDRAQIMNIMNAQNNLYATPGQIANTALSDFDLKGLQKAYMQIMVNRLGHCLELLMVWLSTAFDSTTEGSIAGNNKQNDTINQALHYVNEFNEATAYFIARPAGPETDKDRTEAAKLQDSIVGLNSFVSNQPSMSPILSTFESDYVQATNNITGAEDGQQPLGLLDVIKQMMASPDGTLFGKDLGGWAIDMFQAPTIPVPPTPTPPPSSLSGPPPTPAPVPGPNPNNNIAVQVGGAGTNMLSGQGQAVKTILGQNTTFLTTMEQTVAAIQKNDFSADSQYIKNSQVS